jgi:hypothetical protein
MGGLVCSSDLTAVLRLTTVDQQLSCLQLHPSLMAGMVLALGMSPCLLDEESASLLIWCGRMLVNISASFGGTNPAPPATPHSTLSSCRSCTCLRCSTWS